MTLTEILQSLPAEIGRYELAITRYLDPEAERLMWSMTYECSADGTILPGCDINERDFECAACKFYKWLREHGYITESENNQASWNCQGEAASAKPKFHKGAWVVLTAGELSTTLQIVNVDINKKLYWFNDGSYLPIVDEECLHLWTITDAKDGDVLVSGDVIFIFNKIHGVWVNCYCSLHKDGSFCEENYDLMHIKYAETIYPSTKEQRDTLFAKMKEAGYEWDTENKCLTKI